MSQKITIAIIFLTLAVAGFSSSCSQPPEEVIVKEKVSLGISKSLLSIPIYLAIEKGYFASEGLDLTLREYGSGKLATRAMLAGEVDMSTVADMPIVLNSFKKEDLCIFATFFSSYDFFKIIARKDRGIATGKDLKGKKVGVNKGTSSHFFLGNFVVANQVSLVDVELIYKKTFDMQDALLNNEVDAVSIWQPYAEYIKKSQGENIVELKYPNLCRVTFSLAANKTFIENRLAIQKKILRALDRAATFSQKNSAEAQAIIARTFDIDKDILGKVWDDYTFGISLDQALLVSLDDIARWAIKNQFVDSNEIPNFLDYICLDALEAVKPEAISIIR